MPIPPNKFKPKRSKKEVDPVKVWGEAIDVLLEGRKIEVYNGKLVSMTFKMARRLLGVKGKRLPPMTELVGEKLTEQYTSQGWEKVHMKGCGSFSMTLPTVEEK